MRAADSATRSSTNVADGRGIASRILRALAVSRGTPPHGLARGVVGLAFVSFALATAAIGSSPAAAAVVPAPPAPNVDGRSYEMVTPPDKNSRRTNSGSGGSAAPGAVGPNVGVAFPDGDGLLFPFGVGILDPDGGVNFSSFHDVLPATAQSALEDDISGIDPGDISVVGGPGSAGGTSPYIVTFFANVEFSLCGAIDWG